MTHPGQTPARPTWSSQPNIRRTEPLGRLFRLLVVALLGTLALAACQLDPSPGAQPSASGEPTTTENPQAEDPGLLPVEPTLPTEDPLPSVLPTESATPQPEPSDEPSEDPTDTNGQPSGAVSGSTLFGAAPPMTRFGHDMAAATSDMESKVGRLQARREYRQWNENWGAYVADDQQNGRVSVISVKAPGTAPQSWWKVASGSEDDRIRQQARQLAGYGAPVYLTFHHEPENDAPQSSAAFRAASEHFYDVVKSVAASIQVGPTLMAFTARGGDGRNVDDWLYSNDKMDFIAWDGYNFNGPNGRGWQSPAQIFDRPMAVTTARGKPALISETGVHAAYDGPRGQTPAQWLQAVVDYAEQNGVVLLAYFNTGAQQEQNSVFMSPPMEKVFRSAISQSDARR